MNLAKFFLSNQINYLTSSLSFPKIAEDYRNSLWSENSPAKLLFPNSSWLL